VLRTWRAISVEADGGSVQLLHCLRAANLRTVPRRADLSLGEERADPRKIAGIDALGLGIEQLLDPLLAVARFPHRHAER